MEKNEMEKKGKNLRVGRKKLFSNTLKNIFNMGFFDDSGQKVD